MVNLIIDSTYLDMYGDETIQLTKRSKDARELNNLFADYSNTFTLPATPVNNKIFKHYYNFNVIGGYDARIKTPARLEIDNYTLQDGLIRLDECAIKEGKVDSYKVTFYGNAVNLTDLFGEFTLEELNLSAYNHVRDITNVVKGLDSTQSLFSDDLIYPLISKDRQWTVSDLQGTGTDVDYDELSPAIRVKKVIDQIGTDFGLTFNSDFFDEAHFDKLYLWCPRELDPTTTAVIDANGNPLPFQSYTGTYDQDVINEDLGTYSMNGFNSLGATSGQVAINMTPSDLVTSYTVKMYGMNDAGLWVKHQTYTGSGIIAQLFTWQASDDYAAIRFYVETAGNFTVDYTLDIDYVKGTLVPALDVTSTNVQVDDYQSQFRYKIPSMKVIDFFGGIIKMFNLMITPVSSTEFNIEPYDVWITEGTTRDLTENLKFANANIITPKLPKEVAYRYKEPKGISNAKFNEITGKAYGDAEARTQGGDTAKIVEVEFENMLWELLSAISVLHVGWSFEKPDEGGFSDSAFLMYWGDNLFTPTNLSIGVGVNAVAIPNYKGCNSYYPLYDDTANQPTHSLNFDSELNSFSYDEETVSLFEGFHKNYIDKIFHEALRVHKVEMRLPLHVFTEIDIKDTIKLQDLYYNINSMTLNLSNETASFELINFVRELSATTPPVDTEAPLIGDLSIVYNPDVTAPTIGVLSSSNITGDSITLNWTSATDDVGVVEYQIYQDTVNVKNILGGYNSTVISGLSNLTEYDFYITAKDAAGNTSSASNTVTETTLNVNAPVINSPVTTWWYIPTGGETKTYTTTATNSPDLFDAQNVPSFLTFTAATGVMQGLVNQSDAGNYTVRVRASNDSGTSWGAFKDILIIVIPS